MPRPTKKRRIENIPQVKYFKPAGIPMRKLKEVNLNMEEVEAIRLKDMEGLIQQECADKMEVSRPTFQRILRSAREKIAQALIKGQSIKFQGGDYQLAEGKYSCLNCGQTFKLKNPGRGRRHRHGRGNCPECGEKSLKKKK